MKTEWFANLLCRTLDYPTPKDSVVTGHSNITSVDFISNDIGSNALSLQGSVSMSHWMWSVNAIIRLIRKRVRFINSLKSCLQFWVCLLRLRAPSLSSFGATLVELNSNCKPTIRQGIMSIPCYLAIFSNKEHEKPFTYSQNLSPTVWVTFIKIDFPSSAWTQSYSFRIPTASGLLSSSGLRAILRNVEYRVQHATW